MNINDINREAFLFCSANHKKLVNDKRMSMEDYETFLLLGKDRDGNYILSGKTWVQPCVKGSGPLIEKVRMLL